MATAILALAVLSAASPAGAVGGHWQPAGIRPATAPLASVLARAAAAAGRPGADYGQRVERWSLQVGPTSLHVTVTVRDGDVRFDTTIDGATYSQGRSAGLRWRRTPNGLVRRIRADVQGDDLDRWPLAYFPYDAGDCTLLGETMTAPLAWVVEYRPAHDSPHWFYVDDSSGRITTEVFREGSRNVTFRFSDFRNAHGVVRPFAWHISGAGGDANVAVDDVKPQPISAGAVSLPPSSDPTATFTTPSVRVPAQFNQDRIRIDAIVNGRRGSFLLDTGTTQILINDGATRRFGLQPTLGHAIVHELTTGGVTFSDIAAQTVPFSRLRADGILGYDYFCGHVVHIDYANGRVDLLESNAFTPPAGAHAISADFDEGMPVVAARIGAKTTPDVVLDTGSPNVIVTRALYGGDSAALNRMGIEDLKGRHVVPFLEGPIDVADAYVRNVDFAGSRFLDDEVQVEIQEIGDAVDFPIDAIFGTQLLRKYEWWFDYDAGRIWLRPA